MQRSKLRMIAITMYRLLDVHYVDYTKSYTGGFGFYDMGFELCIWGGVWFLKAECTRAVACVAEVQLNGSQITSAADNSLQVEPLWLMAGTACCA